MIGTGTDMNEPEATAKITTGESMAGRDTAMEEAA
jgi:hypothetical protein